MMKYLLLVLALLLCRESYSQNVSYKLKAENIKVFGCPAKSIEFDIVITNNDPVKDFEYATGQYYFDFNKMIANGGKLSLTKVSSDLPDNMHGKYFEISGDKIGVSVSLPPQEGSGVKIPKGAASEVLIYRLKITTSADHLSDVPLNLQWRSGPTRPYSKIAIFNNGKLLEIQNAASQSVDDKVEVICE